MLRRLLKLSLIGYALFKAGTVVVFLWFLHVTPDPSVLKNVDPLTTSFIQHRCAFGEPGCALRWTPLSKMSPFIPQAVVLAEDIRFFRHGGLDFRNIWAAVKTNWRSGRIIWGGSTLTQQLAKNLYLGSEKTTGRKFREVVLTWKLEHRLSKERILEIYLNVAQWAPSVFGIANASEHFFGKTPSELGPLEASYLASILPNPEHADEPAWKDRFTHSGGQLFEAIVTSYLPPALAAEQGDAASCLQSLNPDEIQKLDYVIAKLFNAFAGDLLSGRIALLTAGDLLRPLTPEEWSFVEGFLGPEDRASGYRAFFTLADLRRNAYCLRR